MTESEKIYRALREVESATAKQLAETTSISVKKVSNVLHHLISSGKVFHIGEVPISNYREVNLYSAIKPSFKSRGLAKQSWLSPLTQ